ncbi:hypothetical protein Tco_0263128, partial [Tanacetum coccineum]
RRLFAWLFVFGMFLDQWRRLDVFGARQLSFSTTGGGIGGPSYETPLRVVIALASFLGFGMVLLGNELEVWLVLPKSSNLVQRLVNKLVTFAI